MTGIDFFDKDIINTLIPVFTMKPDKEVLLYDKKHLNLIDPLINAIKNHGIRQVLPICVDADSFSDIEKKLREVLDSGEDDVYIELTGGSELMNACGYKLGIEYNTLLLHVDYDRMKILDVRKDEVLCDAQNVSLNDYIVGVGGARTDDSHFLPDKEDFSVIKEMAEFIFDNEEQWKLTCNKLMNVTANEEYLIKQLFSEKDRYILAKLVELGFMKDNGSRYEFSNPTAKQYATTIGVWVELYIYINLVEVYGNADIGVGIDWNSRDDFYFRNSEIDVILMYKSIPVFFSCKMKALNPLSVTEVGYLAKRLGGSRAQAVLVTTKTEDEGRGIFRKMKDLRVGCVKISELRKAKSAKEYFDGLLESLGFEM